MAFRTNGWLRAEREQRTPEEGEHGQEERHTSVGLRGSQREGAKGERDGGGEGERQRERERERESEREREREKWYVIEEQATSVM